MDYDGQRLGKKSHCIIRPIVAKQGVNHEILGVYGTNEKAKNTKITFTNGKDMENLSFSSK